MVGFEWGQPFEIKSKDTQPKIEIFLPEPKGCTPTIIIFSHAIYVLHIPNNLFSLTFDIKHNLTLNPFSTAGKLEHQRQEGILAPNHREEKGMCCCT